jgi:hypothetical protein
MGGDLMSFGSLLSRAHDDAALHEVVEGLGGKCRVKPSDQLGFVTIKKAGVEFRFRKASWLAKDPGPLKGPYILTEVGVYAAGRDGYQGYAGKLVKGITFESARADVWKAMGKPITSGGGNRFGTIVFPEWDRYQVRKKYFVEFSYDAESKRVCEVSINLVRLTKD